MNLFEKLAKARRTMAETNMKKSGQNTYSGYDYFELGDFMPYISKLEDELKFCCLPFFISEAGALTGINLIIVDSEKPDDTVTFHSPAADVTLKGAHAIQNLGAVETYLRRYIYMAAFEIVEHDTIDATAGKPDSAPQAAQERKGGRTAPTAQENANKGSQKAQKANAEALDHAASVAKGEHINQEQINELFKMCVTPEGQKDVAKAALLKKEYEARGYKSAKEISPADFPAIKDAMNGYALPNDNPAKPAEKTPEETKEFNKAYAEVYRLIYPNATKEAPGETNGYMYDIYIRYLKEHEAKKVTALTVAQIKELNGIMQAEKEAENVAPPWEQQEQEAQE